MTEREWLACTDPTLMLEFLRDKASPRKLRLLACSFCRRLYSLLPDKNSRNALKVAERFADGLIDRNVLIPAFRSVRYSFARNSSPEVRARSYAAEAAQATAHESAQTAAEQVLRAAYNAAQLIVGHPTDSERMAQVAILHDIIGPTFFRRIRLAPSSLAWNDATIPRLAEAIYKDRTFDQLPILVDALMDSGCHSEKILNHCRSENPHFKGCWVLDLLLKKG